MASIIEEYKELLPLFREVDHIASEKAERCLHEHHFFTMGVLHRVKTEESIRGKLERYKDRFSSIRDMTDVIGLRIICYLSDDVDAISDALKEIFNVSEVRDKRKKENISEFGYASLHLICRIKPEEGISEEATDVFFEIQIRTVLQHAWAEIEHDLGSKNEYRLSPTLRRTFSRVAGLLEIADGQFSELRTDINAYTEHINESIENDRADSLPIDYISINRYFLSSRFMKAYLEDLKQKHGIEITHAGSEGYIEQLLWLDITTLGELEQLFIRSRETISGFLDTGKKYELDIFSDSAILKMAMDAELIAGGYTQEKMTGFYRLLGYDDKKCERHAAWIVKRRSST